MLSDRLGHAALRLAVRPGLARFLREAGDLERVQRRQLAVLLADVSAATHGPRVSPDWSWEDFRAALPVTGWDDWRAPAEAALAGERNAMTRSPVVRFQPTSGSTSAMKLVPYTRRFLAELDAAIAPWIGDLYTQVPGMRRGHHYWSLSWIPTDLRARFRGDLNDDMQLLSLGKRLLAGATQAVPQQVSLAESSDGSLYATLAWLAADAGLSIVSVWSPTFALGLLEKLAEWRLELAATLARGAWPARYAGLERVRCPQSLRASSLLLGWDGRPDPAFFRTLWPQLALVSAWDTASAAPWAALLRERLPFAHFQGKGLWATEGVVTIPVGGQHLLAYRSHVYEFLDAGSGDVLAPWQLERGQRVVPLLSTGSGLLRYRLNDVLEVDGFHGSLPALRFLGRNDGADLVGEKISATYAQQLLDSLALPPGWRPVTLVAAEDAGNGRPGYLLLVDAAQVPPGSEARVGTLLEQALAAHFHYSLARSLGQLPPVRVVAAPGMAALYTSRRSEDGMIAGNVKVEPLVRWRGPLPAALRGGVTAGMPVAAA